MAQLQDLLRGDVVGNLVSACERVEDFRESMGAGEFFRRRFKNFHADFMLRMPVQDCANENGRIKIILHRW
jgi:hypothetical protein